MYRAIRKYGQKFTITHKTIINTFLIILTQSKDIFNC